MLVLWSKYHKTDENHVIFDKKRAGKADRKKKMMKIDNFPKLTIFVFARKKVGKTRKIRKNREIKCTGSGFL